MLIKDEKRVEELTLFVEVWSSKFNRIKNISDIREMGTFKLPQERKIATFSFQQQTKDAIELRIVKKGIGKSYINEGPRTFSKAFSENNGTLNFRKRP
jgi:hypothetical protein